MRKLLRTIADKFYMLKFRRFVVSFRSDPRKFLSKLSPTERELSEKAYKGIWLSSSEKELYLPIRPEN